MIYLLSLFKTQTKSFITDNIHDINFIKFNINHFFSQKFDLIRPAEIVMCYMPSITMYIHKYKNTHKDIYTHRYVCI